MDLDLCLTKFRTFSNGWFVCFMFRTHLRIFIAHVIGLGLISIFLVALIQVEPQLKKKYFIFICKKKWFENPGRDNLVSERSLRKPRPLGRLLSRWVACEVFVV